MKSIERRGEKNDDDDDNKRREDKLRYVRKAQSHLSETRM
jgi:hypothetical protein